MVLNFAQNKNLNNLCVKLELFTDWWRKNSIFHYLTGLPACIKPFKSISAQQPKTPVLLTLEKGWMINPFQVVTHGPNHN